MNKLICFLLAAFTCQASFGQTNINLNIEHLVNEQAFTNGIEFNTNDNYTAKINRLEYYISGIQIEHDGGQIIDASDVYILVDPSDNSSTSYSIGQFDVNSVEKINFLVGVVDSLTNHSDPTSYPADHALAPQNPSMHWGWESGYRFAAIEGTAGIGLINIFEIHTVGDKLKRPISLTTGNVSANNNNTININVKADYFGLFNNIDVEFGLTVHGDTDEAITLMNNFRDYVFSYDNSLVSVNNSIQKFNWSISPNPANNSHIKIDVDRAILQNLNVKIFNSNGLEVYSQKNNTNSIQLPSLSNGIYQVQLIDINEPAKASFKKLIIH